MKIAVVQFDNRPAAELGPLTRLMRRNAAYATRHGYDYHFFPDAHFDLPVYWQKPSLMAEVLKRGYDLAAWLDTDAVVHDPDRPIETLFDVAAIMVGAPDNPHWREPFNAGVFMVRNADGAGQALMDRWSALFAGTAWTRTEAAWICNAEWAGPDYEQGAFNAHLLPELTAAGALKLLDWQVLQSPQPIPGAFTLHFAGPFKAGVAPYLQLAESPGAGARSRST